MCRYVKIKIAAEPHAFEQRVQLGAVGEARVVVTQPRSAPPVKAVQSYSDNLCYILSVYASFGEDVPLTAQTPAPGALRSSVPQTDRGPLPKCPAAARPPVQE